MGREAYQATAERACTLVSVWVSVATGQREFVSLHVSLI